MSYPPEDPASVDLGVPSLDAEHREQLQRMNRLGAAIAAGAPTRSIGDDLESLIDYLEAHFMSEQILMREQAYPAYEAHVREHDEAIILLRKLQVRFHAGDLAALEDLVRGLRGWLIAHIQSADRALSGFLQSKGIEMP